MSTNTEAIKILIHQVKELEASRAEDAKLIGELLDALVVIVTITDRKHDFWDRAKKAISLAAQRGYTHSDEQKEQR